MTAPSPNNPYAPAFADLARRVTACRATPPDQHDQKLADALAVLPFVLDNIIPYYQAPAFIEHAGGADRIVSTILLQTLSLHLNWPDDYRTITRRYRAALLVPQQTIDSFIKATEKSAHYTP